MSFPQSNSPMGADLAGDTFKVVEHRRVALNDSPAIDIEEHLAEFMGELADLLRRVGGNLGGVGDSHGGNLVGTLTPPFEGECPRQHDLKVLTNHENAVV